METNKTDKLLKDFFSEQKQEIADNGFSQRVNRRLPEHIDHSWIVWIFAAIGMALSIYLGITTGLIEQIMLIIKQVSIFYILGGIFCLPLVGSAGYYFTQTKNYQLI